MRPPHLPNIPGDKSITHRAVMLASLADGVSTIEGFLNGADTRATIDAMRALGAEIEEPAPGRLRVHGRGLRGLRAPAAELDCGNSGTTARLLLGILAGQNFAAVLTGDASLRARPMRRVTEPLARMGARIDELGEPDRLPLRIHGGALSPIEYQSPVASAQVKSALLLAGLTGGARVSVTEPGASRDHTERMLRAMGVPVRTDVELRTRGAPPDNGSMATPGAAMTESAGSMTIRADPVERLDPLDLEVPADFSSAAFFLAFALLHPRGTVAMKRVGVNPTRTGLLGVIARMGGGVVSADAAEASGEPTATLGAWHSPLKATVISGAEVPALIDELPLIAALGLRAEGETRVAGAGELRVKESDRIRALVENCRSLGGEAEELPDGFVIRGSTTPLAGTVATRGDHRIAMAFGVLGALTGNEIEIDDQACVDVSFPGFWEELSRAQEAFDA